MTYPRIGDESLQFGRWFTRNRFRLMEGFLGELTCPPEERDAEAIERRFLEATRHAKRVLAARLVVNVLLGLGVVAAAAATLAARLSVPSVIEPEVAAWIAALERTAAIAGSASILLLLARLAFDRYLRLVETTATFLAIQLATCRRG